MIYTFLGLILLLSFPNLQAQVVAGYHLVWHDGFDQGDTPASPSGVLGMVASATMNGGESKN